MIAKMLQIQYDLMKESHSRSLIFNKRRVIPGTFCVYDLGSGTFDVSIAENIGGKVNLQTQGSKEMCGGRYWYRLIFNNVVVSWLRDNFYLPEYFLAKGGGNSYG